MKHRVLFAACLLLATLPAWAKKATPAPATVPTPFASTYQAPAAASVLLRNATVLIGNGQRQDGADVLMQGGKIAAVGKGLSGDGAQVVDATGRWITPGIIDIHSHLGVYPSPGVNAHGDGNEATSPTTPAVWAEHSIWPQDPGFATALAGGTTSMLILPGSANLIGGRGVVVKNVAALTYQDMKFPGAPHGLKMACGENPKRVYGGKGAPPSTRMGNVAGYRSAFIQAQDYRKKWDAWTAGGRKGDAPARDLAMDTLADVLRGEIVVNIHCYRSDEMAVMIDLAREFGFKIATFHHGVEAYKLADVLAKEKICGALWADWWGFKLEAYDAIEENILLVDRVPGGCAIVHSDSSEGIQRLNQEAAKVMGSAKRIGLEIAPEHAIRWITSNAAKALRIDAMTGTLEAGKQADVVLWSGNPFSTYAKAEQVFIDGVRKFDRNDPAMRPVSDFLLGQPAVQGGR